MELYTEQLFRKRKTLPEFILQFVVFAGCFFAAAACIFFFSMLGTSGMGLATGVLIAIILIYFAYKYQWFQRFDKEYEYLYFNGDIDVDVVIAKATRKRLVSVKAENVLRFGVYRDAVRSSVPFDKVVDATSGFETENTICFLIAKVRGAGNVLLIFEPKEEILTHMKRRVSAPFEE